MADGPQSDGRSGRFEAVLAALGCLVIVAAFARLTAWYCVSLPGRPMACELALFRHGSTDDWRYFAGVWEAARVALRDFHQFPSWNPYHCGGIVLFQDPQAPFPGPLFLLTFWWLPAATAMKVWLWLHLWAGGLGACAVGRSLGGRVVDQLFAATLVIACGFCAEHFGGGHLSFTPFLLFPWLLLALRRSVGDVRWSVVLAGLLALCVYEGATYPLPLMFFGLAVEAVLRTLSPTDRRGLLPSLAVTGLLFPLLAAFRLLPVMAYLAEHPRLVPLDDSMTVAEIVQTWTVREHERGFPGHVFVWPEYGDYIGWVPVALVAVALVTALAQHDARRRERLTAVALFAALAWCTLGNIPGFSLFGLLHELPLYKSLRVPSRFLHPLTVAGALLVVQLAVDARRALSALTPRRGIMAAFTATQVVLLIAVAADVTATNGVRLQQGLDPELPRRPASAAFHQAPGEDYWRWSTYAVRGQGTPACYVPLEWGPAPGLRVGPGPQQLLEPPEAGTVRALGWSPNALRFEVALDRPARLVVNQNHESSWRTSAGVVDRARPLLTVSLPAGRRVVTLRHVPRGIETGAVLTALGLALSAWVLRRGTPARVEALRQRAHAWLANAG